MRPSPCWRLALLLVCACNGTTTVEVNPKGAPPRPTLRALRTNPSSLTLEKLGATASIQVTGYYDHGGASVDLTPEAGFSSRDPAVVRVSPGGTLTAMAPGATVIDVVAGQLTREIDVEVLPDVMPPAWLQFFNRHPLTGLRRPAWWGETEKNATVEITGGLQPSTAKADDRGIFAIEVPLVPNRRSSLTITVIDTNGNRSPPSTYEVEHRDALARPGVLSHVAGNGQTGIVDLPLGAPLKVIATARGGVPLAGKNVVWRVLIGGGTIDGRAETTVRTDAQGKAAALPKLGPAVGDGAHMVMATLEGDWGSPVIFNLNGVVEGSGETALKGVVLTEETTAIPGVTLFLKDARGVVLATGTTDDRGRFRLSGFPAGSNYSLTVEGGTATLPGKYPDLIFDVSPLQGIENPMSAPVILPKLPAGVALPLDANGVVTQDVQLSTPVTAVPGLPPMILKVPAGTKVTWPPNLPASERVLRLVTVPTFGVPMPFPNGLSTQSVMAVQPANTLFSPPLPIWMPNVDGIAPGTRVPIFSFDHATRQFENVGTATVDSNGTYVVSDPGSGIRKGAWHTDPDPDPCNTTGCLQVVAPGCPDIKGSVSCTCIASGGQSASCKPGKPVCIPNVPACGPTRTKVRIVCDGENVDDDGSTLKITTPKNGATIPNKDPVNYVAETCPVGRENEIEWDYKTGADVKLIGETKGPKLRLGYLKERKKELIKARLGKARDSITVRITDKCMDVGILTVCGEDITEIVPDSDRWRVTGTVTIGLKDKVLGIQSTNDVEIDNNAILVKGTSGGEPLVVSTTRGRLPFNYPPWELNANNGQFNIPSFVSPKKPDVFKWGGQIGFEKMEVIEGGVEVKAKLGVPEAKIFANSFPPKPPHRADGFKFGIELGAIKLIEDSPPQLKGKISLALNFGPKVPPAKEYTNDDWKPVDDETRGLKGTCEFDIPESLGCTLEVSFKLSSQKVDAVTGEPFTRKAYVGADFNWKKERTTIKFGIKDWNQPIPHAVNLLALQELGAEVAVPWDLFNQAGWEIAATAKITGNREIPVAGRFAYDLFTFEAELRWKPFRTLSGRGKVSLLKEKFPIANGGFDVNDRTPLHVFGNLSLLAPTPVLFKTGIEVFLSLTVDQFYNVNGGGRGTLSVLGFSAEQSLRLTGAFVDDPFIDLQGSIGPFKNALGGKVGPFTLGVRADFHNDKVQFRTCADFQEIRSEAWAGQPVAFNIAPGTDKVMIVVRRTQPVPAPFTLMKPDGSTVSTQGAFNIAYLEEPVTGNSLYFVTAPAAGTWKVTSVQSPATATRVGLMLPNKPPAVSFGLLAPQANGDVVIEYAALDPDDNAHVSLFFDTDDEGFDGEAVPGALKVPEIDGPGTVRWVPAGVPSGDYFVYAVVDDRHDHPARAYAPNRVRIVDPLGPPPPTAVHAVYGSDAVRIDWVPSAMAARYVVTLRAPGHEPVIVDTATPSAVASAVEAGATWHITVVAADANGHLGIASDPVELPALSAGANAPQIVSTPPRRARAGQAFAYDLKATDADPGSVLVYRLGAAPAGASIDATLGTFRWTPAAAQTGTARVEIVVEDQTRRRASQRFEVDVTSPQLANATPEVVSPAPTTARPGQPFAHTVKAVDADGTPLTYALSLAPPGMTIAPGTGAVAWSPTLQSFANGPVPVVVTATNPDGDVAVQRWMLASPDSDGDGLRDSYERGVSLDPLVADSDGDGTPDGMEDSDGDGLTALAEQSAGTSATQRDSDGDGLTDGDEVSRTRSSPLVVDTDADNIGDFDESTRGTDPNKPDTDGDGARDGDEIAAGTNPLMNAGDADVDGLSDDLERLLGTSTTSADTDGDTLSDAYERQGGSNPLSKDTDGDGADDNVDKHPLERRDSDADGLSDDLEGVLKTNPLLTDTDRDGVGDAVEVLAGLNPLDAADNGGPAPRSDGLTGESLAVPPVAQGVTDLGFVTLGRDRDLDGIPDTWELANGLDPSNPADALGDADGDGVSNVTEYRLLLNPNLADTDGDGVSDGAELQQATDPRDPSSNRQGVTLTGLSVAPATLELVINQVQGARPQQLRVVGTFSDGSTADLSSATTGTQYASSNPARLAVSPGGLLTPVQGPDAAATITVTNGAFSQAVPVQVTTFRPRAVSMTPLPVGWLSRSLAAGNRRAYVGTSQGVAIFDTSTPATPRLLSTVPGEVTHLTLSGNTLVLATPGGVTFVDVSDPAAPIQVGRVPMRTPALSVAASGSYVYVLGTGMQVIAMRLPMSGSLEDADGDGVDDRIVNDLGSVSGSRPLANGTVLWVGATFYDISIGAMPQAKGTVMNSGCLGKGTELHATAAVGFCLNGLQTIDFTNLAAPMVLGSLFDIVGMSGSALTTTGELALVTDVALGSGIRIYSVANLRAPAFVTTLDFTPLSATLSDPSSIAADGNLVYGAESRHLLVGQLLEYSDNGITPPLVRIDSPLPTDKITGTKRFDVTVSATDDVGVAQVELFVDGLLAGRKTAPPFVFSVEAPKISGTSLLRLEARAVDFAGNQARATASVTVVGDSTPPVLTFVTPLGGQLLYTAAIDLLATAFDDVAIDRVTFYVDGRPIATSRRAPHAAKWDTCAVQPGLHTLVAEAVDLSGNSTRVVHNVSVVFAAPKLGKPGPEDGTLRFGWSACATPTSYNLYWGTAPGITTSSTRIGGLTGRVHRLSGLTNGTRYWARVTSVVGGVESPLSNEVVGTPQFQHCSRDGWCFESPTTGAVRGDVISLFTLPTGEVLVGTDDGELLMMNAAGWSRVADLAGARITDVWASAPDDVWFTTSGGGRWYPGATQWGAVRRWNGTQVSVELVTQGSPPPGASAIWGFNSGDIWVATPGDSRAGMFHWNGVTWTPTPGPRNTSDVWGATPNDVWAVGVVSAGASWGYDVFRWDGTRWNVATPPFPPADSRSRLAISGTNASNVFVAGWNNLVFRYDGALWTQLTPAPTRDWDGLVVRSPTDVSLVSSNLGSANAQIVEWDGMAFTPVSNRPFDAYVTRIAGGPNGELFTAGGNLTVLKRSGGAWTRLSDLTDGTIGPFDGVDSDVWAVAGVALSVGGQRAMLRNTGTWELVALPTPPLSGSGNAIVAASVKALWARKTPQCAWAVGGTRDAAYFPPRWPEIPWAVRWDGVTWQTVAVPTARMLNGVWGRDCNDVWMVGQGGTMLHWDGVTVSPVNSNTTRHLWELTGTTDGSLYSVSHPFTNGQGTGFFGEPPLKWDGTNWVPMATAGFTAHAMSPLGASTLWTAGSTDFAGCNNNACAGDDVIGRWSGSVWSRLVTPFTGPLFGISAVAPDRVWLLGHGPNGYERLYRWDGAVLTPEQSGMWADLPATYDSRHPHTVFGTPSGDTWLGGVNGRLLHKKP